MKCHICGEDIELNRFINEPELVSRQLCFKCNHWYEQHEADQHDDDRKDHGYAIVHGTHYFLGPHTDSAFKGYGGRKVTVKFFDGTVKECDNLWCQGDIFDAHPYWRSLMPDNATIEWR